MLTTYHRNTDGREVSEAVALDDNGMLKPGFSLRNPTKLMDSRPAALTDAQRRSMIDSYNARISSAWRDPSAQFHQDSENRVRDERLADIRDPRERYEYRLQNAWKE